MTSPLLYVTRNSSPPSKVILNPSIAFQHTGIVPERGSTCVEPDYEYCEHPKLNLSVAVFEKYMEERGDTKI
jgi:hypothetical protein